MTCRRYRRGSFVVLTHVTANVEGVAQSKGLPGGMDAILTERPGCLTGTWKVDGSGPSVATRSVIY